jgi:predicted small metal-binding protein
MLTVSCRDVGMDCDYVCKGETEEEIMKNAEQHAVQDHHYKAEDIMTPELQQKIKSHIKSLNHSSILIIYSSNLMGFPK